MAKKSDKPDTEAPIAYDASSDGQALAAVLKEIAAGVRENAIKLERLERQQEKANVFMETYQKASGQVVNLAFGLIIMATVVVILTAIVGS